MLTRHGKLPSIAGLTDRPAPIKSGKPLKDRVKICYRSDLYMKEQQKNVVMFQDQLRQALADLRTAKPDSLEFHTARVEELKVKGEEMIIILQVLKFTMSGQSPLKPHHCCMDISNIWSRITKNRILSKECLRNADGQHRTNLINMYLSLNMYLSC